MIFGQYIQLAPGDTQFFTGLISQGRQYRLSGSFLFQCGGFLTAPQNKFADVPLKTGIGQVFLDGLLVRFGILSQLGMNKRCNLT